MNIRPLVVLSLAVAASSAIAAEPTIERIAPKNTIIVMSVSNAQETMARFKRTNLWELWQSDEMSETRRELIDEYDKGVMEMLEELELDQEGLAPPTGAMGVALFAVTDEETGLPAPGLIGCADYGDNADETAELIQAMLTKGEEDGALEYEEVDVQGRIAIKVTVIEEAPDDEDAMDMGGMNPMAAMPDPEQMLDQLSTMHYLREGSSFIVCTDLDGLSDALAAMDDDDTAGRLEEREELRAVRRQLGSVDGYAALLPRDLGKLLAAADSTGMMFMMIQPIVPLIFGDIKAVGSGVRLDGDAAMLEQSFAVYMPNGKSGLPALMDTPSPRSDLPAFVGADTVTYASVNLETDKLADFVRTVVQTVPMLQMQAGEQLPEIIETIEQFTATLGTQVHQVTTVRRPFDADSLQQLYALECTQPEALEGLLASLAPQMGLEPRDFLGQRIYAPSDAMAAGMMAGELPSLGIGGGHLFVGGTVGVEQALRSISRGDGAGLAADTDFARAIAMLPSGPTVAWGYSQAVDAMEASIKVQELANAEMMREMREQFPEFAEQMEEEAGEEDDFLQELDYELLRQYFGPAVWFVESTDEGFVGRSYQMSGGE